MPISVPPYMPIQQQQRPNIDIAGSIGGLGDALQQGLEFGRKRKIDRATQEAFASGIPTGPNGEPDYQAMAAQLFQAGNVDAGMGLTRLAETQLQNQFLRGRPQYMPGPGGAIFTEPTVPGEEPREVVPGVKPKPERPIVASPGSTIIDPTGEQPPITVPDRPPKLTSTDRKAVRDAGQNNLSVRQTRSALKRALELNAKIFTGAGAEARQTLGTQLPDWMVPDQVADPKTAQATEEWRQIMTPEAVTKMATTLAGSDSNFELQQFVRMFADPKTTPQTRSAMIRRMLEMTDAQEAYNNDVINESKNADLQAEPPAPEPAPQQAAPPQPAPDEATPPAAGEPPQEGGRVVEMSGGRRFMLMPDGTVIQLD